CAQPEPVHDASDVIGVIAYAEAGENGLGEAASGPQVGVESGSSRTSLVDLGYLAELFGIQAAGTSRSAPLAQALHAFTREGAAPSRSGSAAHSEFAGDLGLGKPLLQVLSSFEA